MFNEDNSLTSKLSIKTSLKKAIEIYPLTQYSSLNHKNNTFLRGMFIKFNDPRFGMATFMYTSTIPEIVWFSLFNESEKEIIEDSYIFYGIEYKTKVDLALKRIKQLQEKFLSSFGGKDKNNSDDNLFNSNGYKTAKLEQLKDATEALSNFSDQDEISLFFLFDEWPSVENAKKREYVREFEEKYLGKFTS